MGIKVIVREDGDIDIRETCGPFSDYSPADKITFDPTTKRCLIQFYDHPMFICDSIKSLIHFLNTDRSLKDGIIICILLKILCK
jgi:hypothetical protein